LPDTRSKIGCFRVRSISITRLKIACTSLSVPALSKPQGPVAVSAAVALQVEATLLTFSLPQRTVGCTSNGEKLMLYLMHACYFPAGPHGCCVHFAPHRPESGSFQALLDPTKLCKYKCFPTKNSVLLLFFLKKEVTIL
jgi:hypothetical protein